MKQNFAAIILGGTGQVGDAAVAELLTIPECRESCDGHQKAHCGEIAGAQRLANGESILIIRKAKA